MKNLREKKRIARHKRLRARIRGDSDVPRLTVHRTLKNMNLQLIDDERARTIFIMTTSSKDFKSKLPYRGNAKAAALLGELFAKEALNKGIKKIVFDRGGYVYHGRIKAVAEALRKGGLEF